MRQIKRKIVLCVCERDRDRGEERKEKEKKGWENKGLEYPNSDIDQETGEIGKWLRVLLVPLCNLSLVSDSHVRQITTISNSLHL